jgi:hypothetical protein
VCLLLLFCVQMFNFISLVGHDLSNQLHRLGHVQKVTADDFRNYLKEKDLLLIVLIDLWETFWWST